MKLFTFSPLHAIIQTEIIRIKTKLKNNIMKQYIKLFMLALSITCNLEASLPVQYWNNNIKKPKSTI